MTLSDRLAKAKKERLIAQGMLHSENALLPDPATEEAKPDTRESTFVPFEFDVLPRHVVSVAPEAPSGLFATASDTTSTCPSCNRLGRIDLVDLVGHRRHYTCDACGAMWQVKEPTEAEITDR